MRTQTQYRDHTLNPDTKTTAKINNQQTQPMCSPISQLFKKKQATVWKSLQDQILVEDGTIVEEIFYTFPADLNFRAYGKPTQVFPSLNNTFIVHFHGEYGRGSKIVHYSSVGRSIKLIYFQEGALDVQMLSQKLVLIFIKNKKEEHRIEQWDIEKHERISIPYLQVFNEKIKMLIFPKTQLFCISEFDCSRWNGWGRQKPKIQLSLTYYRYPLIGKEDTFLTQLSRTFKKQTDVVKICMEKLNQQSMVGFINQQLKGEKYTRFCTYSLGKQNKIQQRIHKFPNNFHKHSDICQTKIVNLWQIQQNIFLINLQTEINLNQIDYEQDQEKYDEQTIKQIERNYTFIWNYEKGTYHQANINLDEDSVVQVVDCFKNYQRIQRKRPNLHQRYLAQNFRILPNLPLKNRTIKYADVINDKIAVEIISKLPQNECREQGPKSYPAYLPNYQVQSYISRKHTVNIWIRRVKCLKFPPAEIAIYFMQEFMKVNQQTQKQNNEEVQIQSQEWDEDLLFYICQIFNNKELATTCNYKIGSSLMKEEEFWI